LDLSDAQPVQLTLRVLAREQIDAALIEQWEHLEQRSLEPNAFLSPHFIIPALEHLTPDLQVDIVAVGGGAGQLLGLGIFCRQRPTRQMPLPRLCAYRSPHSYRTGLLIDRTFSDCVADAFVGYFGQARNRWRAVEFVDLRLDGPLDRALLGAARRQGVRWKSYHEKTRAILEPARCGAFERSQRVHDAAELRRKRRRLGERGTVSWRLAIGAEVGPDQTEQLLALEHSGWKGEQRESLLSQPAHAQFCRDMAERFRRAGRVFFCELMVDGRVIASANYLLSGNVGFAFKIGWDPVYAKASPGVLNEVEFIEHVGERLGTLEYIDSGAQPGSFIDALWPQRATLGTRALLGRGIPAAFDPLLDALRAIKARWRAVRAAMPRPGGR